MEPLATLAELEAHLQHPVDPASGQLALENASGAVRAYCGWRIDRAAETFFCDGTGTSLLSLPTLYLHTVAQVLLDGVVLDEAAGDYGWSHHGQLWRVAGWPALPRIAQADVVHGFDPAPDACRAVTLNLASRQTVNPLGLRSATVGTVTRAYSTEAHASQGMTALDAALLAPFRLPGQP